MVLLYDSMFQPHLGKLCMHWLGLFIVQAVTDSDAVKLQTLEDRPLKGYINGSWLKPCNDSHATQTT